MSEWAALSAHLLQMRAWDVGWRIQLPDLVVVVGKRDDARPDEWTVEVTVTTRSSRPDGAVIEANSEVPYLLANAQLPPLPGEGET